MSMQANAQSFFQTIGAEYGDSERLGVNQMHRRVAQELEGPERGLGPRTARTRRGRMSVAAESDRNAQWGCAKQKK